MYIDDRCVKKLVPPWKFTAAICFYILLTQLTESPQFQERAGVANDNSCLNYMLPVNMQVGHG